MRRNRRLNGITCVFIFLSYTINLLFFSFSLPVRTTVTNQEMRIVHLFLSFIVASTEILSSFMNADHLDIRFHIRIVRENFWGIWVLFANVQNDWRTALKNRKTPFQLRICYIIRHWSSWHFLFLRVDLVFLTFSLNYAWRLEPREITKRKWIIMALPFHNLIL